MRLLLAESIDEAHLPKLKYPVLVSRKEDGMRVTIYKGQAVTRRVEPLGNDFTRKWLELNIPEGMEGELTLRSGNPLQDVTSAFSSQAGRPDFVFNVFEWRIPLQTSFEERLRRIFTWYLDRSQGILAANRPGLTDPWHKLLLKCGEPQPQAKSTAPARIRIIPSFWHGDSEEVLAFYRTVLEDKGEGIVIRAPDGPYKFGRSTKKEGYFLKLVPLHECEVDVIGWKESMTNTNKATVDKRGYTKRSSAKSGKVGKGVLGSLHCMLASGAQFHVSGFDDKTRVELFKIRHQLPGMRATIRYKVLTAAGKPREPVFVAFRTDLPTNRKRKTS